MACNYIINICINRGMSIPNHGSRKEVRPLEKESWNLPPKLSFTPKHSYRWSRQWKITWFCGSCDAFLFVTPLCQVQPQAFWCGETEERKWGGCRSKRRKEWGKGATEKLNGIAIPPMHRVSLNINYCLQHYSPTSGSVAWTLVNKALVAVFS